MEKAVIGGMGAIIMMVVMAQVVQAMTPTPPTYCCPICAQLGTPLCFATYGELEQHFSTEHPAVDIDIIWE